VTGHWVALGVLTVERFSRLAIWPTGSGRRGPLVVERCRNPCREGGLLTHSGLGVECNAFRLAGPYAVSQGQWDAVG
jgi:hypothetical protein